MRRTIAALTPASGYKHYPPYLNISRGYDGRIVVTVRANESDEGACGGTLQAVFGKDEFAGFLTDLFAESNAFS